MASAEVSAAKAAVAGTANNAPRRLVVRKELADFGVKLIGGGLDEAPFAYKDIHEVMKCQTNLVDVVGKFYPAIVQMDGSDPRKFRKRKVEAAGE